MQTEELIENISKEFRKEEFDIKARTKKNTHYRNGLLQGILIAEIIVKQQMRK